MFQFKKHPFISNTLTLTAAGMLSRIIGFFYRIFISQTIGAEYLGLYQLVTPVLLVCFSLTGSGMQTAVSSSIASLNPLQKSKGKYHILALASIITVIISFSLAVLLYLFADTISMSVLFEPRTEILLKILCFCVPLESLHACFNGFYFGISQTMIPAISQLIEQTCRAITVATLLMCLTLPTTASILAVIAAGSFFAELFTILYCIYCVTAKYKKELPSKSHFQLSDLTQYICPLFSQSVPLSFNRTFLNLLGSIEASLVPAMLRAFGYSAKDALSIFGIFTGLTMPLIMFPQSLVASASIMILPNISSYAAANNVKAIRRTFRQGTWFCISLGVSCTAVFFLFGDLIGTFLFSNTLAGDFVKTLCFICPFLYLNTTFSSILNGLKKSGLVFLLSSISILIRLGFTYFLTPVIGIHGFLYGMLTSQLVTVFAYGFILKSLH